MFASRKIETQHHWLDTDGIKIYTISFDGLVVDQSPFVERLKKVKQSKTIEWINTPAFVIFHQGEHVPYLVLAWWGNDNELFTSVSVLLESGWVEDASRFSFCIYDLEIFGYEREAYIETMYSGVPNIECYRRWRGKQA